MSKEGSSFCFVSQVDSCIVEALCFVVDPWINACWAAQQIAHRLVCAVVPLQLYAIFDNGGTRHLPPPLLPVRPCLLPLIPMRMTNTICGIL